ncbi:MAG: hypothetical protein SFU56_10960 [Capsulimonadales bacterium]|nr:hypothetical protein [Capsulimonadales bacterium]
MTIWGILTLISFALSTVGGDAQTPTGDAPKPAPAPTDTLVHLRADWPAVPPPNDPDAAGRGIQRTMRLLATSTPQHRNSVRILFYGQSITEQKWWEQVADDLRRRFPHADLDIRNRAIGGFASQRLIRPAQHDIFPWYPDLVIFHVYGADQEYEEIIRNIRTRTTAEILMQKDHVTRWPLPVHDPSADKSDWWDDRMNHQRLPEIAAKYDCGLVDVRGEWLRYLKANALEPKDLLTDGVHLNEHGCFVLAEIVKQYLVYRPERKADDPRVRDVVVGQDVRWKEGRLTLDFVGNRVDLLPGARGGGGSVRILIDGKAPSAHPECYTFSRPAPNPWASPLALVRVDSVRPLLSEDWTLTVTEVTGEKDDVVWSYRVVGSLTGEDGTGKSDAVFVSASGRVRIEPASFFRGFNPPLPKNHRITWQSYLMGTDHYRFERVADPGRENAVLLAQGLENGPHRLELIVEGKTPAPIRALRVYRP